ncbi:hypothetical protein SASC598O11_005650, partial [Snodgrassella alvi SCGC AB-598-O11]
MPEELTDEAGEIVWECSYQLWGKPIQEIAHRGDTTEPEVSGTVFRQRNRTALQYFQ